MLFAFLVYPLTGATEESLFSSELTFASAPPSVWLCLQSLFDTATAVVTSFLPSVMAEVAADSPQFADLWKRLFQTASRKILPHRIFLFALFYKDPALFRQVELIRTTNKNHKRALLLAVQSFEPQISFQELRTWATTNQFIDADGKHQELQGEATQIMKKVTEEWEALFNCSRNIDFSPLDSSVLPKVDSWARTRQQSESKSESKSDSQSRPVSQTGPRPHLFSFEQLAAWAREAKIGDDLVEILEKAKFSSQDWAELPDEGWDRVIPDYGKQYRLHRLMQMRNILKPGPYTPEILLAGNSNLPPESSRRVYALTTELQQAQRIGDYKRVAVLGTKIANLIANSPSPAQALTAHGPGDDIKHVIDLENSITQYAAGTPSAIPRSTRVSNAVQAAGAQLSQPAASSRANSTHPRFSLFGLDSAVEGKTGMDALTDILSARVKTEKFDEATPVREERKRFAQLHPECEFVVPRGMHDARHYLDLALKRFLNRPMHPTTQEAEAVRVLEHVKEMIWQAEARAAELPLYGDLVLGYIAIAGVYAAQRGWEHFQFFFQPQIYGYVVSPQVWEGCREAARRYVVHQGYVARISELAKISKRLRDRDLFSNAIQGILPASLPHMTQSPSDSKRNSKPLLKSALKPLDDGWSPSPNPLDGCLPPKKLLNSMRAAYQAHFGPPETPCPHCGLNHGSAKVCHWQKFPAHRSASFTTLWALLRKHNLVKQTQIQEWNSRAGRLPEHRCGGDGKSSRGWHNVRKGHPQGPPSA